MSAIRKEDKLQTKKTPRFREGFQYGRGGETRTRDTRFWRPVLYQLSYAPKLRLTLCLLKLAGIIK